MRIVQRKRKGVTDNYLKKSSSGDMIHEYTELESKNLHSLYFALSLATYLEPQTGKARRRTSGWRDRLGAAASWWYCRVVGNKGEEAWKGGERFVVIFSI